MDEFISTYFGKYNLQRFKSLLSVLNGSVFIGTAHGVSLTAYGTF